MDEKTEHKQPMKTISFIVGGVQYKIGCTLTAGDFMRINEFCAEEHENYRELIVQLIHKKMRTEAEVQHPSLVQVEALDDSIFDRYIEGVLEQYGEYRVAYDQLSDVRDPYERFAQSIRKHVADNLAAAISNSNLIPIMGKVAEQSRQFQEMAQKVMIPALQNIAAYTKKILESSIGPITAALEKLGKMVSEIQTPTLTDSEKDALIDSYQKWGEYGWTMAPEMNFGFFDVPPTDRKTANKEALKFCTKQDMAKLFDELRQMEGVKLSDLEEAIFDFEQRKYKSCIMIIYSLIDAKLIRLQRKEDRTGKKNSRGEKMRSTGAKAGENVINRIRNLPQGQQSLLLSLMCINLLSCMKEVFKPGDDFVSQPEEANRHFIAHGMLIRSVKRMDCVKAFLFYYNLLYLINWKL